MTNFKVGDVVRVVDELYAAQRKGSIERVTKIGPGGGIYLDGCIYYENELELVTPAQPKNPNMVTYTVTVPKEMFPFAPGREVVYFKDNVCTWEEGIFVIYTHTGIYKYHIYSKKAQRVLRKNICYPLTTHKHLIGTYYPAGTPACKECGKAEPDCICAQKQSTATTADGVIQPEFQPFDKVLVRNSDRVVWKSDLFSHIELVDKETYFTCIYNSWLQCIPYEGNEHLLGTTDAPNGDN